MGDTFSVQKYIAWVESDKYDVESDPMLCTCLSCSIQHGEDFDRDPDGFRAEQIRVAREVEA